jgi:hypothetical protein
MPVGPGLISAALLLAACSKPPPTAPWLTMPRVAAHGHWFPIGASDVHGARVEAATACDGCHLDKATGLPSSTFRTFTCTGCHVPLRTGVFHDQPADLLTLHATVADYASTVAAQASSVAALNGGTGPQTAEDGACRLCHPTGWAVNHVAVFPLPHQDPAGSQVAVCTDCHLDVSDRTQLGCAPCHPHDSAATASAHASVPDFAAATSSSPPATLLYASARCARCHADGTVPVTVAGHATPSGGFLLGTGAHSGASGGGCLDCHPAARADKPFGADFAVYTCGATCHGVVPITSAGAHDDATALGAFHALSSIDFAGKVTALGFDAACRSCHPAGTVDLPADHPFPVGATLAHPLGTCASCHTGSPRSDPAQFGCGSCHLTLDPALGAKHTLPVTVIPVTDYATGSDRCLRCHGDSQVNWTANHPTGDETPSGNDTHLTAGCLTCHGGLRTDKPFSTDWESRTCVTATCHPGGVPTGP